MDAVDQIAGVVGRAAGGAGRVEPVEVSGRLRFAHAVAAGHQVAEVIEAGGVGQCGLRRSGCRWRPAG